MRYGILGIVDDDRVAYHRDVVKRDTRDSEFAVRTIDQLPRVDVVLVYQSASGDVVKAIEDQGAKGIVMATAGADATSGTQNDGIRYAIDEGVFVVTTTRTGSGRVAAGRGRRGGYRIAREDLQPVKARILLMLALAHTTDGAEIQRMFTEY